MDQSSFSKLFDDRPRYEYQVLSIYRSYFNFSSFVPTVLLVGRCGIISLVGLVVVIIIASNVHDGFSCFL